MSEFEKIDVSLAIEGPRPEIHFLALEERVSEIKDKIMSLSKETEIDEFISIETRYTEIQRNPNGWIEFLLTIDWTAAMRVIGGVSGLITIGTFLYKVFKFLRERYAKRQIKKLGMKCSTSIPLAITHLRNIGARMRQIRLVYLSRILAYYCVAIFASPATNPKELHVIVTHIDGKTSSYNLITL